MPKDYIIEAYEQIHKNGYHLDEAFWDRLASIAGKGWSGLKKALTPRTPSEEIADFRAAQQADTAKKYAEYQKTIGKAQLAATKREAEFQKGKEKETLGSLLKPTKSPKSLEGDPAQQFKEPVQPVEPKELKKAPLVTGPRKLNLPPIPKNVPALQPGVVKLPGQPNQPVAPSEPSATKQGTDIASGMFSKKPLPVGSTFKKSAFVPQGNVPTQTNLPVVKKPDYTPTPVPPYTPGSKSAKTLTPSFTPKQKPEPVITDPKKFPNPVINKKEGYLSQRTNLPVVQTKPTEDPLAKLKKNVGFVSPGKTSVAGANLPKPPLKSTETRKKSAYPALPKPPLSKKENLENRLTNDLYLMERLEELGLLDEILMERSLDDQYEMGYHRDPFIKAKKFKK